MDVKCIQYERSGGFAGITFKADIQAETLPEPEMETIASLLEETHFMELPASLIDEASRPDQFIYTVTVETITQVHTVITGEESAPEKMQELLDLLQKIARQQARNDIP